MPPLSPLSATFPTDVLLDTAVLYINGSTPFAVSGGDLAFDAGEEWQNLGDEVDGVFYPIQGLDRKTGGVPKITGSIIELAATRMDELLPGQTQAGVTDIVVTPKAAGDLLATGDYLTNVRCVWRRGNGHYVIVTFPVGINKKVGISGQKKNNGSFPIEIEARATTASPNVAPYTITFTDTI